MKKSYLPLKRGDQVKIYNRTTSGDIEFEDTAEIVEILLDRWQGQGEAFCRVRFPDGLFERWVYLADQLDDKNS